MSAILTAAERATNRADRSGVVEAFLTDTCAVLMPLTERQQRGSAKTAGYVVRPQPGLPGVDPEAIPCRLVMLDLPVPLAETGGGYGRSGELLDVTADQWALTLPLGAVVAGEDRVRKADGTVFDVRIENTPATDIAAVRVTAVRSKMEQPGAGQG